MKTITGRIAIIGDIPADVLRDMRRVIQASREFELVEIRDGEVFRSVVADLDFAKLEERILAFADHPPCKVLSDFDVSWHRSPVDVQKEERVEKTNPWYLREQRGGRKSKNRRW